MRIGMTFGVGALVACLATPAMAQSSFIDIKDDIQSTVKCVRGESVAYVLDFDRTSAGEPLTFSSFVSRGQSCLKGDTQYTLTGFMGSYKSPRDIRRAIDAIRTLEQLGLGRAMADLAPGFAFVRELDAPKREVAKK